MAGLPFNLELNLFIYCSLAAIDKLSVNSTIFFIPEGHQFVVGRLLFSFEPNHVSEPAST